MNKFIKLSSNLESELFSTIIDIYHRHCAAKTLHKFASQKQGLSLTTTWNLLKLSQSDKDVHTPFDLSNKSKALATTVSMLDQEIMQIVENANTTEEKNEELRKLLVSKVNTTEAGRKTYMEVMWDYLGGCAQKIAHKLWRDTCKEDPFYIIGWEDMADVGFLQLMGVTSSKSKQQQAPKPPRNQKDEVAQTAYKESLEKWERDKEMASQSRTPKEVERGTGPYPYFSSTYEPENEVREYKPGMIEAKNSMFLKSLERYDRILAYYQNVPKGADTSTMDTNSLEPRRRVILMSDVWLGALKQYIQNAFTAEKRKLMKYNFVNQDLLFSDNSDESMMSLLDNIGDTQGNKLQTVIDSEITAIDVLEKAVMWLYQPKEQRPRLPETPFKYNGEEDDESPDSAANQVALVRDYIESEYQVSWSDSKKCAQILEDIIAGKRYVLFGTPVTQDWINRNQEKAETNQAIRQHLLEATERVTGESGTGINAKPTSTKSTSKSIVEPERIEEELQKTTSDMPKALEAVNWLMDEGLLQPDNFLAGGGRAFKDSLNSESALAISQILTQAFFEAFNYYATTAKKAIPVGKDEKSFTKVNGGSLFQYFKNLAEEKIMALDTIDNKTKMLILQSKGFNDVNIRYKVSFWLRMAFMKMALDALNEKRVENDKTPLTMANVSQNPKILEQLATSAHAALFVNRPGLKWTAPRAPQVDEETGKNKYVDQSQFSVVDEKGMLPTTHLPPSQYSGQMATEFGDAGAALTGYRAFDRAKENEGLTESDMSFLGPDYQKFRKQFQQYPHTTYVYPFETPNNSTRVQSLQGALPGQERAKAVAFADMLIRQAQRANDANRIALRNKLYRIASKVI